MFNKELIQYTVTNNHIHFPGTNQAGDFQITLQCWPKDGVHAGAYKWAMREIDKIKGLISKSDQVIVSGHSLGGLIAQVVAWMLYLDGYNVELEILNAMPAFRRILSLTGKAVIYGNDIVPCVFPWLRYPCGIEYQGPARKWWKISFKDHLGGGV